MSRSIDERIVEMRFDNKQFEGGIKESLTSLSKLEEVLNKNISANSLEGINKAANNIDLSGISKGVELLSQRFSTLGIVGMRVIENITDGLMNGLSKAINQVTNSIVSGGIKRAMNIENAHFQLQGLIDDENQVQAVMKQASESVDGTAYSYDAAAKAASMFAASGLKAGDEMKNALKGIAGVAATTNSDYEGVSRIFTTVAGQGRLMGDQLLQLSSRGMNAAAALKDFFNGVSSGSIKASKNVTEAINSIMDAEGAMLGSVEEREAAFKQELEAASETFSKEYELRKKTLDKEYKALQKSLNEQYSAKKAAFDKEYKALSESLDREIKAQQKANNDRIKEADKAYKEDVANYRKAAEEKIALIDKEYAESLKLIDKEAYEKTKAIDDEIKAINDQEEAEAKARKEAERTRRLADLEKAIAVADTIEAREEAEKALSEFREQLAEEELAESRRLRIKKLQEEKSAIQEEASEKKQAAKEERDASVTAVKEETEATLNAMSEKHEAEKEALQEQLQAQIEQMQTAKTERLEALKATQNAELDALKESQNAQLEVYRETQNEQLEALQKANKEKLAEMKAAMEEQLKAVSAFSTAAGITEADIRDMVSKGLISFDIFSEAMATTFGDHAKDANKTFTGALANIRAALSRTGALFITPLIEQGGEFVQLFNAIRVKINDFNKALGASNGLAQEFTTWVKKIVGRLATLVENFKIANTITTTYGKGIQTVWESASQTMVKVGDEAEKITTQKIYTPFHAFQDVVRTVANVFKGLVSIIKPVVNAFQEVFLTASTADGFYSFIERVRILSQNLKISDENAQRLKDGFVGVFSIVKAVIGVFARFFEVLTGTKTETSGFADAISLVIKFIGDVLTAIADWIQNSTILNAIIVGLGTAIPTAFKYISNAISAVINWFGKLKEKVDDNNKSNKVLLRLFEGLKSIGDAVISVFLRLFDSTSSNVDATDLLATAVGNLLGFIADVVGTIGDLLVKFADWIKTSPAVESAISGVKNVALKLVTAVSEDKLGLWDKFHNLLEKISKLDFKAVGESMKNLVKNAGKFLTQGFSEGMKDKLDLVVKAATKMGQIVLDTICDLLGIHSPATETIKLGENTGQGFINGIGNTFADVAKAAGDLVSSFFSGFSKASSEMSSDGKALNESVDEINPVLDWITNKLIPAFADNALAIAGATALFAALIKLAQIVQKLNTGLSIMGTVRGVANAYAKDLRADAFKKSAEAFAIGLLAIVAALAILSQIPGKNLGAAVFVLSIIIGELVAVVAALINAINSINTIENAANQAAIGFKKGMQRLGSAAVLVAVGKSIKDFAKAIGMIIIDIAGIMILYNVNKEGFMAAIGIVELISLMLMGVIAAMTVLGEKMTKGMLAFAAVTAGVFALSLSLGVIVGAFKTIMNMDFEEKNVVGRLLLLTYLMGLVAALGIAIGGAGSITGGNNIKAGPILALCALIFSVVSALKSILKLEISLDAIPKMGIFILMFGLLETLIISMGLAARASGGNSIQMAGTLLAMCALIITITGTLMVLTSFPVNKILNVIVGLGLMLMTLAKILQMTAQLLNGDAKAGNTILAMAVMVAAIVGALVVLSLVEWTSLIPATFSLGIVLFTLSMVFAAVAKITNQEAYISVLSMCAILAGVIIGLKALSNVDSWEKLVAAGIAMGTVLLALGGCFKLLNTSTTPDMDHVMEFILGAIAIAWIAQVLKMTDGMAWETMLSTAGSIAAVMLAIAGTFKIMNSVGTVEPGAIVGIIVGCLCAAAIGWLLTQVSGVDWQAQLSTVGAVAAALLAIAATFAIMQAVQVNITAIGAFIAGCAGVALVGLAISEAAKQPWEQLLAAGVSISVVILAMAIAMVILTSVGALAEAALIGVAALDAFIADLVIVLAALGGLTKIPGFNDLINAGGGLLIKLGKSLGDFVGSIIEGIGEGVGRALEAVGKSLANFMIYATPFFIGLKMIDKDTVAAAKSLAGVVLALSVAGFVDGVSNLFSVFTGSKSMDTFGLKLVAFGSAITAFDLATRTVNAEHLKIVADGALTLIDMARKIPNEGGWLAKIMGENDLAVFGAKLAAFGPSLTLFDLSIKGITNVSKWKDVAEGTLALVDMASKIPNSGGLVADVTGDNDIGVFGRSLNNFAYWIKSFSIYTSEIKNLKDWKAIADGTKHLIVLARNIPNSGGLVSLVTGDNDIGTFARSLNTFGYWMKSFGIYTSAITNLKDWPTIASSTKQLIDMVKMIQNTKSDKVGGFANDLAKLAKDGLTKFMSVFAEQTPKAVQSINAFLAKISTAVSSSTILSTAFTNLATKSTNAYNTGITNQTAKVITAVTTLLTKIILAIKNKDEEFKRAGAENAKYYLEGIRTLETAAATTGRAISIKVSEGIKSYQNDFTLNGKAMAFNFLNGFANEVDNHAEKVAATLARTMINRLDDSEEDFNRSGKHAAMGFANGLEDCVDRVARVARRMAYEAKKAIEEELEIESPSKVLREDGQYAGDGFALGFIDRIKDVKRAAMTLGATSIDALEESVQNIPDIDPVITPIVDLTNVNEAADMINDMFSHAIANVGTNVGRASSSMNYKKSTNNMQDIQNGDSSNGGTNVTFIQNNNSPKSLSRIDIYRQTRNQLAQFKEAVART